MQIFQYVLGSLSTNCYLLEKDMQALIIDPVDSADFLLEEVSRRKLDLIGIIATHGHFDHIMAAGEMQIAYRDLRRLPLHIHPDDFFLVKRITKSARYFLGYEPDVIVPNHLEDLHEGDLCMGSYQFRVIYTPGHTPGGVSFFSKNDGLLFSGDTLFRESTGRADFSYSNQADLVTSVQKLLDLPKETRVYPGHGESTTIEHEQMVYS